jgi:pimeloyl-ACP methyl ester carboxylesterase
VKKFLSFLVSLLACFLLQASSKSAQAAPEARWIVQTDSDVVFVFVHGIFSDSDAGWRHPDRTFWPDLLVADQRLKRPNIYLGGYPSSLSDPNYGIEAAARHLFGRLNGVGQAGEPSVLSKQMIIFVAHSTGGLVVRQMLVNEAAAFGDKKIGLFLLASPSRGSEWASRASGLTNTLGHKMIAELTSNSPFTVRLDKLFSELLARKRIWMIAGMDVFESRFIADDFRIKETLAAARVQ